MSSSTAAVTVAELSPLRGPGAPAPVREKPRPHIEVVPSAPQKKARPRVVYAVVAVSGLFAIIAVQLLLSVGLSQGAYTISGLQAEKKSLSRSNADAQHVVDQLSSPQNLAASALGLGMVANTSPVYLRLSDGAVLGVPAQATGEAAGAQNLVPNSLLTPSEAELATAAAVAAAATAASAPASTEPSVAAEQAATVPVPLQGELPAPSTH